MKIKLVMFGEAVNIPTTSFGLGVGLFKVFVDGSGFTSGSNDLGALGYVFIETQEVDLGQVDPQKQALFGDLTNRLVTFNITPNTFVKDGGIVRVSLTITTQDGGLLTNHTLEYIAEDCTGIALVTNTLRFTANMSPMEKSLADFTDGEVVPDGDVVAIVDAAPSSSRGTARA